MNNCMNAKKYQKNDGKKTEEKPAKTNVLQFNSNIKS